MTISPTRLSSIQTQELSLICSLPSRLSSRQTVSPMAMASTVLALGLVALALAVSPGDAATVEHTFVVKDVVMRRLCEDTRITAVNGQFPGPLLEVTEGDTLVVHVVNESPFGVTIHWHGVKQRMNCWADGVGMVTQCPIPPRSKFTYKFNVTGQEGTLWWHAHTSFLRATLHGALIIRPKGGIEAYPFPKPDKEVPIILGEWWKTNVVQVEKDVVMGSYEDMSSGYTINGMLGDSNNCSGMIEENYKLDVESGKIYLLRITNAALYTELFYKVAGHWFTVVAADASYVKPYSTKVIVIAPGQTVDALMVANAPLGQYYMVANVFQPPRQGFKQPSQYITRGIVKYISTSPYLDRAVMPHLPQAHDIVTAHHFYSSLTSLSGAQQPKVPVNVDERLFIAFGMGAVCKDGQTFCKLSERIGAASMNNVSFQLPTRISLLQAYYNSAEGIYTKDFPREPQLFNFTNRALLNLSHPEEQAVELTKKGTKVVRLKYNSTVEIVLQNTVVLAFESHPIHLHGFNFFVVAQGYGNYDAKRAMGAYNLVDPQVRNTLSVPTGGWAVIRFVADNPGMWYMHCHLDVHMPIGMATAFEVDDGPTPDTSLPPPPEDLPICASEDHIKTMHKRNSHAQYQ